MSAKKPARAFVCPCCGRAPIIPVRITTLVESQALLCPGAARLVERALGEFIRDMDARFGIVDEGSA